jgi:hypothetical protein
MAPETEHPIAPPTGGLTGTREAPDSPFLEDPARPQEPEEPKTRKELAAEAKTVAGELVSVIGKLVRKPSAESKEHEADKDLSANGEHGADGDHSNGPSPAEVREPAQ